MDDLSPILKAEFLRFRQIVEEVDFASLDQLQEAFDDINARLRDADSEQRDRFIQHISRSIGDSLIDRGVGKQRAEKIKTTIVQNWEEIVINDETFIINEVLTRTVVEWEELNTSLDENIPGPPKKTSLKRIIVTAGDLIAGGGLLVFDAAKFLLVTPPPVYMFSSFMAGAMFFKKGVDRIILGR